MKVNDFKFMPEFFDRYINLSNPDIDLMTQLKDTTFLLDKLREELIEFQNYQYQQGKWSPKDILQHIIDTERVQAYRALAFARNDKNIMPGYDENVYAKNTSLEDKSIDDLLEEFKAVRSSTIHLFKNFTKEMFLKEGVCFSVNISVLALGFVIVGHPIHHISVLNDNYFSGTFNHE
ncbi:DinB family protein [Flavicella sp.]|uniref:DinB family protein n=1 Tax=Flavicella sp. TaxID=2957742 RepID=UPI00301ABE16